MNKYFKHTKKLLFLVATMVMMLATTLVVLGAVPSSEAAAKYSPLTILKVGTHTKKNDQYKYDKFGNKTIGTAKPVIYTNGYTAADEWMGNQPQFEVDLNGTDGFEMVELDNFIKLEVSARVGYDTDANGKIDAYTNGSYKVKSSNESVATVTPGTETKWDNEGNEYESQYIIITAGEKTGTATIKLTEANPANPKRPKTATVKVTVKKLVDGIEFDDDVVKADANDELYTEVGVKGKVTLGTKPTADASKKTVKYVLDATAKNYISVSSKGVITAKKSTADLEGGYVTVRVVAQDMQYNYYNSKSQLKKATWGTNETIKVYVGNPTVKSAKILNVDFAKDTTESKYKAGKAAQAYKAIPLVTNVSSVAHSFKLQVAAYSDTKWSGAERVDAVRFTTSNAKVATVDKNGVITAKANGSATITVVPADGVALSGKEALKVSVKVTTEVEKIETANTDIETFAGKTYKIKANVNAGVSNSKAKGLKYEIVTATPAVALAEGEVYTINEEKNLTTTDFKEYVKGITGAKNEAAGKILSNVEGEVLVRIFLKDATVAEAHPDIEKYVTINFVDPISKITATVPVYQDIYKDKENEIKFDHTPIKDSSKTTLYVDRNSYDYTDDWELVTETVDDTCVIKTTVAKKFTGATNLDKVEATSSNTNVVKVLGKVEGGFEVQAVGKGSAKVTVAATDGSKVKKVVTINVVQKVNEINVTNAYDGEIYLAPDNKGVTKTTFKAATNADANNKGVTYRFTPDAELYYNENTRDIYNSLLKKTSSISINKAANEKLFPEGGNTDPVLLGTLTVTAKDKLHFEKYVAPEVNHLPVETEIQVYAVKQAEYVDSELLAEKVDAMVAELADGEEGITLYRGEKLNLAAALEIPATITDRAVTWSVGVDKKDTDKNYISVKNGVVTANKATVIGDTVTVRVTMKDSATTTIYEDVEVRVIPSQADFNKELNTQITTLLKENDYTWLGAKPKFDTKKATLTLTISDVTMGKDAANAEMREKLTNVVKVFKDAAKVATYGTATEYTGLSVYDAVAGKTWTLQLAGSKVVVFENNVEVGTYALTEVDAALDKLVTFITADVDDIVEWANKKLVVTLNADSTAVIPGPDRAEQYNTKYYTTQYTVAVAVSDKDVEAFIDNKIAKAVEAFADKNAGKESSTGIESVTYNADKNATLVEIYNGSVAIESVLPIVKVDAVASLEDIFMNAVSAKVEIVDDDNVRRFVEFNRNENSDVENLVAKLYAELTKELGEDATMKDLEGIAVYATVDFDFAGKVYTKSYNVSFRRSVVAVDAEVDERINTFINGLEANPYGTIEYSDVDNLAIVTVTDYDATLQDAARAVVGKVEGFVNTLTSDAHAAKATINAVPVAESEDGIGKITATDILQVIKPDWYKPEAGGVSSRQLSELIGTTAVVEVTYDQGQVLYYTVVFSVDKAQAEANITEVVDTQVEAMHAAETTEESIILDAYKLQDNTALIVLNDLKTKTSTKERTPIAELADTGFYTMLEAMMAEAKEYCAEAVTVTVGTKTASANINDATVSKLIDSLKLEYIADLTKNPFNITITFADANELVYVVKFADISNTPTALTKVSYKASIRPGKIVRYDGRVGEMILTVKGADAYVLYNGKLYTAVDGVVTVQIEKAAENPEFSIGTLGTKSISYQVDLVYPLGHRMNPEVLELNVDMPYEEYWDGALPEGDEAGYFYTYKAEEKGTVQFRFAEQSANADIVVNNEPMLEKGEKDTWGNPILTVEVEEDDVLQIQVVAVKNEIEKPNGDVEYQIPALDYSMAVIFEYPLGTSENPIDLGNITIPSYDTKVTVKAGETVWYEANGIGGNLMQIYEAAGCTVTHGGKTFTANEDGLLEVTFNYPMGFMPVSFAIANNTEADVEYSLNFNYPLGSEGNPYPVILSEDGATAFEVAAYSTAYYASSRAIYGKEMVINNVGNCIVTILGRTIAPDANGTISVVLPTDKEMCGQPITISVTNDSEENVVLTAKFAVQEGTMDNPEVITELGNHEVELKEGNNGYFFTWTAEKAGTLTFDISATTGGWTYCINNLWQSKYGDTHWSDDESVVTSESISVEAGDLVQIIVGTYDPKGTSPEGTIKFAIDFAE